MVRIGVGVGARLDSVYLIHKIEETNKGGRKRI